MNAVYFMNLPYEKINNSLPFTPQASFQNSPGTGLTQNAQYAMYMPLHTVCINTLPVLYLLFSELSTIQEMEMFCIIYILDVFTLYILFLIYYKGNLSSDNHTNLISTFCIFIAQHAMDMSDNTQYFIYSRLRQMHIIYNSTLCK